MNQVDIWRLQLSRAAERLDLIRERESEYVLRTDVPLELIREERQLAMRIKVLRRQIDQAKPLELLRTATKLVTGPVARTLDGMTWQNLRQQLLTRASKLPSSSYLDIAALETVSDDLMQLISKLRVLLQAYQIDQNPGQLEALERQAAQLSRHLLAIYQLSPGEAAELDTLVGTTARGVEGANDALEEQGQSESLCRG